MINKKLLVVSIIVIVVIGIFLILGMNDGIVETNSDVELTGEVKEFDIVATNWEFTPPLIEVNLGDKVELHMTSSEGTHGIAFLEFGVSEILREGEDVHVEFIADKTGTFNFFCTVPCGRGHGGMKGLFVVK